jgi:hypothetical protein
MQMNFHFGKRMNAFADGVITGYDAVGTILGHTTRYKGSDGYLADVYGFRTSVVGKDYESDCAPCEDPIKRGFGEQAWKGAGDFVGLAANIATLGIPQIFSMADYIAHERILEETRKSKKSNVALVIDSNGFIF